MPHDVIMPALGMAQESGLIVAWHKAPGDAVAEGDVLFEVETDKATMEVEAQGAGYLSGVTAAKGDDVPVGQVIARITETPEEAEAPATPPPSEAASEEALPEGQSVIMPTLGMAQDSGLLVNWLVEPGGKVGADDPLFEVETDKSTMEVPAGADGYLAARLAAAGEDVPTGQVIAIITAEAPAQTIDRSLGDAPAPVESAKPAPAAPASASPKPTKTKPPARPAAQAQAPVSGGRILASPKARRLALERGLDLARLVEAGHPQPYHVKDLEVLEALPQAAAAAPSSAAARRHLTANLPAEGFTGFAAWAAETADRKDAQALLAALAGTCLPAGQTLVAVETLGQTRHFRVDGPNLGAVSEAEDTTPDLILRDLRMTRVTGLHLGAEDAPTLSLATTGDGLSLTLECAAHQLTATEAVTLLSDFAGRMEQPLRHLL